MNSGGGHDRGGMRADSRTFIAVLLIDTLCVVLFEQRPTARTRIHRPRPEFVRIERSLATSPIEVRTVEPLRRLVSFASKSDPEVAECSGTVVDAHGAPIEGASVDALRYEGENRGWEFAEHSVATDGRGRFRIALHGASRVLVRKSGFGLRIDEVMSTATGTVRMGDAVSIFGRVTDARSAMPVEGARITVIGNWPESLATATTDENGRYRIDDLPTSVRSEAGTAWAWGIAIAPRNTCPRHENFRVGTAGEVQRDFELGEGPTYRGRVVDLLTGEALSDCSIGVLEGWGALSEQFVFSRDVNRSDLAGSFEVLNLPVPQQWSCEVRLSKPGYAESLRRVDARSRPDTTFAASEFVIAPSCALEGIVRGRDGKPEANARITAFGPEEWPQYFRPPIPFPAGLHPLGPVTPSVFTDSRGRYRLDGLWPWCERPYFRIHSPSAGDFVYRAAAFVSQAEVQRHDFDFSKNDSHVNGAVTIEGAPARGTIEWRQDGLSRAVETDDRGHYEFDGVPAGDVEFAFCFGSSPWDATLAKGEFAVEPHSVFGIDIAPILDLGRISGRVVDDVDGTPVAGARVWARTIGWPGESVANPATSSREVVTGADGRFVLFLPEYGWQRYEVWAGGGRIEMVPGARDVEITARRSH